MSYYHIKNIKIDRINNTISADLADNNLSPLKWIHVDNLYNKKTFKEKYAYFIYDLVSGNFHTFENNKYSKLVLNKYLTNYYDDVHDIGMLETFDKYKDAIKDILNNNYYDLKVIPSDREIRPELYYNLYPINLETKHKLAYYKNLKEELYGFNGKKLYCCDTDGYPLTIVFNEEQFRKYNSFLQENEDKLTKFSELCGDWDFRNIDMTTPHLQSIKISGNNIIAICEKYSTDLEEYVFSSENIITNKNLVKNFENLDLSSNEDVLNFINDIERHIDFRKVEKELEIEEDIEKNKEYEEYDK